MAHFLPNISHKFQYFRKRSFEFEWRGAIEPEKLSNSGFFYTGTGDQVECFSCHIRLDNWERDDDPIRRHVLASPNCSYIFSLDGIRHLVEGYFKKEETRSQNLEETRKQLQGFLKENKELKDKIQTLKQKISKDNDAYKEIEDLKLEKNRVINDFCEEIDKLKRENEKLCSEKGHLETVNHNLDVLLEAALARLGLNSIEL